MKKLVATIASSVLTACSMLMAFASPSLAAAAALPASCDYTLVAPSRVVMNVYEKQFSTHVTVPSNEAVCLTNTYDWGASADLDMDHNGCAKYLGCNYVWDYQQPGLSFEVRAGFKPATDKWTDPGCYAFTKTSDHTDIPCTFHTHTITIKYASRPKLSVTRSGSKVTFQARAVRFTQKNLGTWIPESTSLSVQRLVKSTWVTIHTATPTNAKLGYTWSTTDKSSASYRLVSAPTSAAFAGTSSTVVK